MEFERIWKNPDVFVAEVPFAQLGLDHTNCFLVRDGADALLVDPGAHTPFVDKAIAHAMRKVGVDPQKVRFFCTHLHFDHVANLKAMARPGSTILMGAEAYHTNPYNFYKLRGALLRSVLLEEGVTRPEIRGIAAVMAEARVCDLDGREYVLLQDGQEVRVGQRVLRVITTPGHTRGHVCLYDAEAELLISGDHVLEKKTPGLSLPFEGDDSMAEYLKSLSKVEGLACRLVLPGHGKPFSGLAERCESLRSHHAWRLGQVYETVARRPGVNGGAVMHAMPWKKSGPIKDWERLNPISRISMAAQTYSYLEYLVNKGEIVRFEDRAGRHYEIAR